MPSRSSRHHGRYDDPYTFDDPYIHSPPASNKSPAYEYVGTDEPLTPRYESPPRNRYPRDQDRSRRHRTTSPPRRSQPDRTYTPPPHTSRHSSPPRQKDRSREKALDGRKPSKKQPFYRDFAENPKVQQYGKKGLTFISEAAAAYAAAQAGKDGAKPPPDSPRTRSVDRGDRHGRGSHRHSSSRRGRRHASSPSRSPSPPPRRRHSTRHGDRDRERGERGGHGSTHRRRHSPSPPPLSRDPDSYIESRRPDADRDRERGRDRRHRRHHSRHSPSPSPSPSPSRRSRPRGSTAPPSKAAAERWQMAARAALEAGGLTAFRLRKEPGGWSGEKAAKVATAALGAAAMDAFMDQDPRAEKKGMKGMAENAVTSMLASKIMGGKSTRQRRRSRF
ncbi:hypothetical protein F4808DRAFT_130404 [Astrocystis sublimbata]|nr:hypothetical protein F4808DRAFT_130404 [Astrocystis sublimbata]